MAIIKCKMCGGDLEIQEGQNIGVCQYCGSTMTLPKVSDDQRAAAFNRGNHFRRIGEFDKALQVYERIVREDENDAEAHWCCALSRFGIEYVEDPASFEYIPTCHRASFDNFLEDVDYLAAVEHSDGVTRRQYQKDGAKIAEVQRGILATSQNEEPYDVFICYKETDENGDRTRDSAMAQDIYYQLTEQGRRVFFARITLEDKVGAEYEPYIFAALHSAKVMVVVGTSAENLNAVWVKNEWSRFLAMMKHDRNKILLPCYRDMDPYDLPDQLGVLQSYDMSKIGFIQDLTRGISKVLDADKQPEPVKETVVIQQNGAGEIAPLLKRAFMFLEDGDWDSAGEYCERVLDMNPECAEAYLGELMADLHVKKREHLRDTAEPFDEGSRYEKIFRFAEEGLKKELTDCNAFIRHRNEQARLEEIYCKTKKTMQSGKTEADYKSAAAQFQSISSFKDAADLAKKCLELAESARKNAIYDVARAMMTGETIRSYEEAIEDLKTISDWKDAGQQITVCQTKIKEIREKEEQQRLEREQKAEQRKQEEVRQAEVHRQEVEKRKKKTKKIAMIVTPIGCVCVALVILLQTVILPSQKLKKANALLDAGDYEAAYAMLEQMERADIISENKYNRALTQIEDGNYPSAIELLKQLNYKDSKQIMKEITHEYFNEKFSSVSVGDQIVFGTYEQDNIDNGQENIEWMVLDKKDGKILVVSKYALDCLPYHSQKCETVTWENCSLRHWLNGEFITTAFTEEEQMIISTVHVSADRNPSYLINPGNSTDDKVFILSILDVQRYLPTDQDRICKSTSYASAKQPNSHDFWWLRSPGRKPNTPSTISSGGLIDIINFEAHFNYIAVRPAMWIDLEN